MATSPFKGLRPSLRAWRRWRTSVKVSSNINGWLFPGLGCCRSEVKGVEDRGQGSVQVSGVEAQAVHWAAGGGCQLEHLSTNHYKDEYYYNKIPNEKGETCSQLPVNSGFSVCPKGGLLHSMMNHWQSCDSCLSLYSKGHCHEAPPTPSHISC